NVSAVAAAPVLLLMWTLGALHQAEAAHAEPLPLPGKFEPGNHLHHSTLNAVVEIRSEERRVGIEYSYVRQPHTEYIYLFGTLHTSIFFSSRRRHTRFSRDWSSDVCSSDLTCPPSQLRPCCC